MPPRKKTVKVNNKVVVIEEKKIKELREETIPSLLQGLKLEGSKLESLATIDIGTVIESLEGKIAEYFPELTPEDIDEAYPSEIEGLIEGFIEVNFSGLRKVYKPVLSLMRMGIMMSPSFSAGNLDGSPTSGSNIQ